MNTTRLKEIIKEEYEKLLEFGWEYDVPKEHWDKLYKKKMITKKYYDEMTKDDKKKKVKEGVLREKKNDFVATGEKVLISIHNQPEEDMNERLYNDIVDLIKKMPKRKIWPPKKIDITY